MNLRRSKVRAEFNMSSLTDIIFLLLIFFMLTSTLVNPNALKLLLPKATGQTMSKQTVVVSIDKDLKYYVDSKPVAFNQIEGLLLQKTGGVDEAAIVLNAEKSVPIDNVVQIMALANKNNLKMVIATEPKK